MVRVRLDTISDFIRHGYNLRIVCTNPECGHVVVVSPDRFLSMRVRVQGMFEIDGLERRLRCRRCRLRKARIDPEHDGQRREPAWIRATRKTD